MDGFTYNNLFETKGVEYLLIIAFLILVVPFWIQINKPQNIAESVKRSVRAITAGILRIPEGLFYGKNHTWAHLESSGTAKVGLDDLLLNITGMVDIENIKSPGESVKKGEVLTEIHKGGKRLRILSPLSGEIVNSNSYVVQDPSMLNMDPFGSGWLYRIKPSNWKDETKSYHMGGDAVEWFSSELARFRDFLATSMNKHSLTPSPLVLQEGGEPAENVLSELSEEIWTEFEKEFLNMPQV